MKYIDGFAAVAFLVLFCVELWARNGTMAAMYLALAWAYFRLWAESDL